VLPFLLVSVLLALVLSPVPGQGEPSRIPVFVIGHAQFVVCCNPFRALFMEDPLFEFSLYPLPPDLDDRDKQKLDRVYYPRTGQALTDSYDAIVFHDARIQHFTTRQIHELDHAFRESGMAGLAAYSLSWDSAWLPTVLFDVSPIADYGEHHHYVSYSIRFRRDRDPVALPFIELGMEKVVGNQYDEMKAKQGATIWAEMEPVKLPWMVSWRPGGGNAGMQWAWPNNFGLWWGIGAPGYNPYAIDMATNVLLYSLDRPLISDIHARREARRFLSTFQAQKLLILSMMEWADNFGANIFPLHDELTALERDAENATIYYLNQDYTETVAFMDSLSPRIARITEDALRLKDQALFWVYLSEWSGVTGTCIIAGMVLWSLMVRRRMYRDVEATRLSSSH
jgi:hypothetical protein